MVTIAAPAPRSGAQLMQDFDRRLQRAEREAAAAQAELDRVGGRLERVRAAEAGSLRDLARLRLATLGQGGAEAIAQLDSASRRVRELLEERARQAERAEAELAERRAAVQEATSRRDAAAEALARAEAAVGAALEQARARLAEDAEWRRRREAAQRAAIVARHAEDKAAFAERDREVKGKPYLDDPLFAYLWNRGYGTAAYRAGPLARALDGFVARAAGYERNRRAFALLTELPGRLRDHAGRMAEEARLRAADLAEHEARAGGLPDQGATAAPRGELDRAEAALQAAHAALLAAENRRGAYAAGDDPAARDATGLLEKALAQESLRELREAAARTPTPEDDALVGRLVEARRERAELERQITIRRLEAKGAREQIEQLLGMREEMRQRGYTRSHWSFGDGALLGVLLGQVLGGAMSRDGFWDRMEQHRLPAPGPWGPVPGGGGNSPWGDSPWGGPAPDPWGGSGGGFDTGGSFGGGGFRTGGSF